MSKKLEEKQQRRLAEERKKAEIHRAAVRRNLLFGSIVLVVALIVGGLIFNQKRQENSPGALIGTSVADAGCTQPEEHEDEGNQHVPAGTDVTYGTTPPTSGDHYGTPDGPKLPGFYLQEDTNVPEEALVHNLEHGQIVFWYRPSDDQVAADLQDLIDKQPPEYQQTLVAAPYAQVPDGYGFSMSAWGVSESCENVSEEAINIFRRAYQGKGPETFPTIPPFTGTG